MEDGRYLRQGRMEGGGRGEDKKERLEEGKGSSEGEV